MSRLLASNGFNRCLSVAVVLLIIGGIAYESRGGSFSLQQTLVAGVSSIGAMVAELPIVSLVVSIFR